MTAINKIMSFIESIAKILIAAAMFAMISIVSIAVIKRYIFGTSDIWADELVRYLLIWTTFIGAAISFRHFDLVLLDLFVGFLPKKIKAFTAIAVHIISIGFVLFIFYASLKYTLSPSVMLKTSAGLGISMVWAYASIPAGFGLMTLFGLLNMPQLINNFFNMDNGGAVDKN